MRCPRCRRETSDPASAFCRRCGAPLRLGEEAARPMDAPVAIDRRRDAELAAPDRSQWDIGIAVAGRSEPSPGAVAFAAASATPRSFDPAPPPEANGLEPAVRRGVEPADGGVPDADVEALEIHLRRPPPWRRAAAGALDALPFVASGLALVRSLVREAAAGLRAPVTGLDGLLDLVARERVIVLSIAAAVALALSVYATLAHALAGATLGKQLLRLRVVGPDGGRPSLARSAVRSGLAVLSAALLGLGLLLALFTRSGRSLHDLLARTWVVEAP